MEKIILGLGSNIGDSLQYLRNAVHSLSAFTSDFKVSSVYKTKPRDYLDQSDFLNLVFTANYEGRPETLLLECQRIELENNRARNKRIIKGPRTLDIDILLFGKKLIISDTLVIPHPAMKERQFVLIPLLELLPDFAEPISNMPYKYFLEKLEDQGVEKFSKLF